MEFQNGTELKDALSLKLLKKQAFLVIFQTLNSYGIYPTLFAVCNSNLVLLKHRFVPNLDRSFQSSIYILDHFQLDWWDANYVLDSADKAWNIIDDNIHHLFEII